MLHEIEWCYSGMAVSSFGIDNVPHHEQTIQQFSNLSQVLLHCGLYETKNGDESDTCFLRFFSCVF